MRRWTTREGLLLLALCGGGLTACGSSGGASPDGGGVTATCVLNKVTLTGVLGGEPVDVQVDLTSYAFQQGLPPYTFDFGYANSMAHLEWTTVLLIDAPAAAATGTIMMPAGAPHAGETICGASGSIKDTDPDGTQVHDNYGFTLGTLSSGPGCPGATLAGSLSGCVGT